jgi:HlyD family secretion protein
MANRKAWVGKLWLIAVLLAVVATAGAAYYLTTNQSSTAGRAAESQESRPSDDVRVEVVHPLKGAMPRMTVQPGSVQSFESAQLVAGVAGYLKSQTVDIGDRVQKGQVLARVDVPDLEKQVQQHAAALEAAGAHVSQMKARVASAEADVEAARSEVVRAQAATETTKATRVFRTKQFHRMQDLFASHSIDERLVDEKEDEKDAAVAAENEAHATLAKANAMVTAASAKVQQAQADVLDAAAEVKVAQAELEKAQVMVQFATITSPYTGVITDRTMFPGDYVRAATESGEHKPLLTVERTDKMRVVVQVPDRDVPYCVVGDRAVVEVDALPGLPLEAKVSRLAHSEDPTTRLMRVEIDVENPTGKITQGMYGRVTIYLEQAADLLSVPSSCLAGKSETGKGSVFVVRDGKAHLTKVEVGADNGVRVAVPKGLNVEDLVVLYPASDLEDGASIAGVPEAKDEGKEAP